jgi:hypothetical protein
MSYYKRKKRAIRQEPMGGHSKAIVTIFDDGSKEIYHPPSSDEDSAMMSSDPSPDVYDQWLKGLSQSPPEPPEGETLNEEELRRLKLYQLSK